MYFSVDYDCQKHSITILVCPEASPNPQVNSMASLANAKWSYITEGKIVLTNNKILHRAMLHLPFTGTFSSTQN